MKGRLPNSAITRMTVLTPAVFLLNRRGSARPPHNDRAPGSLPRAKLCFPATAFVANSVSQRSVAFSKPRRNAITLQGVTHRSAFVQMPRAQALDTDDRVIGAQERDRSTLRLKSHAIPISSAVSVPWLNCCCQLMVYVPHLAAWRLSRNSHLSGRCYPKSSLRDHRRKRWSYAR